MEATSAVGLDPFAQMYVGFQTALANSSPFCPFNPGEHCFWSFPLDTTQLFDGLYLFRARACDLSGDCTTSAALNGRRAWIANNPQPPTVFSNLKEGDVVTSPVRFIGQANDPSEIVDVDVEVVLDPFVGTVFVTHPLVTLSDRPDICGVQWTSDFVDLFPATTR